MPPNTGGGAGPAPGALPPAEPILRDPNPGLLRGLLHGIYDLAWLAASLIGSPWLLYKSLRRPGFAGMVSDRLGFGLPRRVASDEAILIHGVSVGEIKAAVPLVETIVARYPELRVIVSATTNTGMQVARDLFPEHTVVRFPVDITPILGRFLRRLRPRAVILVELEIWPNFLRVANRQGVPVGVVNGRITDRSFQHYRYFRRLLPQFNRISLFCVQAAPYAERFLGLGVAPERVLVTGNIKADGLGIGRVAPGEELERLLGGRPGQLVLVAGSTHDPEELHLVEAWRRGCPGARLILVPRHPERAPELVRSLGERGARPQRLTELRAGGEAPDPARPILVDTIGELERVYGLADLVFIGGSLIEHGGQNMLEPAAQGIAVVVGPSTENFAREMELLLLEDGCLQVGGPSELADALGELSADPERRERMAAGGLRVAQAQRGATELTLGALERIRALPDADIRL